MRTIKSEISRMIPGRPGLRLLVPFPHQMPLPAHQGIGSYDGFQLQQVASPYCLGFPGNRSASVNRMRLPWKRSFSNRFSASRYSMTISCCHGPWSALLAVDTGEPPKVGPGLSGPEPAPAIPPIRHCQGLNRTAPRISKRSKARPELDRTSIRSRADGFPWMTG